jgi:hypothetical protein
MKSIKCDVCKRRIKDFDHYVEVGYGIPLPQYTICEECAGPIIDFLEAHGLQSFSDKQGISWSANLEEIIFKA